MFPRLAARLTIGYYATLTPVMRQGFPLHPTPCPPSVRPTPYTSRPTAPNGSSSAPRNRPAGPPAAGAGSSSSTSTPRGSSTSICGSRWTASSARGRCRRGPRTTPTTSASRCTSRITRSSTATSRGSSPQGNYGAGAVIVWDRGEWVPLEDPREGLEKGKLLFELKGYKLHGKWTLVKIKKSEKDWLLIKERDAYVMTSRGDQLPEESVLSGLTVEELRRGRRPPASRSGRAWTTRARRAKARGRHVGAAHARGDGRRAVHPRGLAASSSSSTATACSRRGSAGEPLLLTRNGNDYRRRLSRDRPRDQGAAVRRLLLDGEVVVLDDDGRPSFPRLQQRGR